MAADDNAYGPLATEISLPPGLGGTSVTQNMLDELYARGRGVGSGDVNSKVQDQAYALYIANALAAMKRQKEAERTETPFPQPGKALTANNLAAPEQGYGPSGTIFTGGVPYKPNYGAQDAAAAGMLLSNVLEAYKKNQDRFKKSQSEQP